MTARRPSHQDKVKNAYAALEAMQEEEEAKAAAAASAEAPETSSAQEPAVVESVSSAGTEPSRPEQEVVEEAAQDPEEAATEPPMPKEAAAPSAPPVPPQRVRTPRQPKAPRTAKSPAPAADKTGSGNKKIRFTVSMDSDLINLMSLARVAFPGGKTIAQVYFAAARRHAAIAADLPDTPLIETVLDDKYDDIVTQAAHRTAYSGYVKPKAYAALAADAFAAGLESSDFVRRTVRRYLAVEHAFVPAAKGHLLVQPSTSCDAIMEELKVQMSSGRPAAVLPTPGGAVWEAVELRDGTPLRALTDKALVTMPGCTSATQALLTVL